MHDRLYIVKIGAADAMNAAFAQIDTPCPIAVMLQSDDTIAPYHFRSVDAQELVGVHPRFQ